MAEFYSARGWEIPPLPWTNCSPSAQTRHNTPITLCQQGYCNPMISRRYSYPAQRCASAVPLNLLNSLGKQANGTETQNNKGVRCARARVACAHVCAYARGRTRARARRGVFSGGKGRNVNPYLSILLKDNNNKAFYPAQLWHTWHNPPSKVLILNNSPGTPLAHRLYVFVPERLFFGQLSLRTRGDPVRHLDP